MSLRALCRRPSLLLRRSGRSRAARRLVSRQAEGSLQVTPHQKSIQKPVEFEQQPDRPSLPLNELNRKGRPNYPIETLATRTPCRKGLFGSRLTAAFLLLV